MRQCIFVLARKTEPLSVRRSAVNVCGCSCHGCRRRQSKVGSDDDDDDDDDDDARSVNTPTFSFPTRSASQQRAIKISAINRVGGGGGAKLLLSCFST